MSEQAEGVPHGLEIAPASRERVLKGCYEQLDRWSAAMPPTEPLVIDFGLGEFDRYGLFEFWIANEMEAGYCGKYMYLQDGQECPMHMHRVKHETFFLVHGQLEVVIDGESLTLSEGQTLAVQPTKMHSFRAKGGPALMLELSMPCVPMDNYFQSPQTMDWLHAGLGVSDAHATATVPCA